MVRTTRRRVGAGVAAVVGTAAGAVLGSVALGGPLPASAEVGTDTLREGEAVTSGSGDHLRSRNGQHVLRWEANEGFDFVGQRFGSSYVFTFAVSDIDDMGATSRLVLQDDANLVAYGPGGEVLFASNTFTTEAVRLVLQDDGHLVLYTASNRVLWASGATPSTMEAYAYSEGSAVGPTALLPGHYLLSPDRRYRLVMQGDGNVVMYGPTGRAVWATATFGGADSVFVAQTDGNLVVYDGGRAVWASGTARRLSAPFDSFTAALQGDGNFVQYSFSGESGIARAIWSSRSGRLR